MSYSYKSVGPNGKTNGSNFLAFLSIKLGEDYDTWYNNPEFRNTIQQAHEVIFNEEGEHRPGLRLRTYFLSENAKQPTTTKVKIQCYNDVLYDALDAGIIDTSKFKQLLV